MNLMCKKDYQSLLSGNIYNLKMNGSLSCYIDIELTTYCVMSISFKMVRKTEGFTTLGWIQQPYLYDYFYTLEEMRDLKINSIFV